MNGPNFTTSWLGSMPVPATPKPNLIPGDVWTLIEHVNGLLANAPMTAQQRGIFTALRDRLTNVASTQPPSIPRLLAPWLEAIAKKDIEATGTLGKALVDGAFANGDPEGCDGMRAAMLSCTATLEPWFTGAGTSATEKAKSWVAGDGVIEWIEPSETCFYVPYGESGEALHEALEDLRTVDVHIARGAEPPSRLFYEGEPGNGKTAAAMWIASQLGMTLAVVKLAGLVSKWMGETSANLAACANAARERNAILFLDEIDSIGGRRDRNAGDGSDDHTVKVVSAANQIFDSAPPAQIIIGATNLPDAVDPSILRRLARGARIKFGNPDRNARETMVKWFWKDAPFSGDAFDTIVARTDDTSGDYVRTVAMGANRRAGRRGREVEITSADVMAAIARAGKRTTMQTDRPSGLLIRG